MNIPCIYWKDFIMQWCYIAIGFVSSAVELQECYDLRADVVTKSSMLNCKHNLTYIVVHSSI